MYSDLLGRVCRISFKSLRVFETSVRSPVESFGVLLYKQTSMRTFCSVCFSLWLRGQDGTRKMHTVAVSEGVKWTLITNQDECENKHIVALPSASESCRFRSTDLRHLIVEGEYVVIRNNRVTNWTFVNNTLQNENGKCLNAWSQLSTYLFESECSDD